MDSHFNETGATPSSVPAPADALLEGTNEGTLTTKRDNSRYRAMVEWSPEPMCVNLGGLFEYVNPATVALFGARSATELVGRTMIDFVHPDYHDVARERRTAVENGADSVPLREIAFLKIDGTTIICEARGLAVTIDGQRAILVAIRDITLRKRAEATLAHNQERLQRVLAVSDIGLWEWEIETSKLYFSPEWKRNLGYDDSELADHTDLWADRMHPEDLVLVQRTLHEFISGLRPSHEVEFRMRHRDETWHWYWSEADIIRSPEGVALRVVGTQIDITERRRDEVALRENEMRLRLALRGANLGLWDWDVTTGAMVVNDLWMTMLGMDPNGPRPGISDWHARVHPDDLATLGKLQAEIYSNAKLVEFEAEIRARHEDGSYRWIVDRGQVAARDANDTPLRIVGTHSDVTERKEAELLRVSLEAQLRESQKMQAIGTLAGGVAHDFNNILAAILGNTELARGDATDARVLESLAEIERAGKRGRDLVRQILSFSRRQPIARRAIQLVDVVDESIALLRATLPARISLDVTRDKDLPLVLADPTQIEQVIINLASNALHVIEDDHGQITIGLDVASFDPTSVDPGQGWSTFRNFADAWPGESIRLSVTDNGAGMNPATLARIFEPFYTTKPINEGTGLGLSVVYGIVESHGGAIRVVTAPGKGSCFSVYLPVHTQTDNDAVGQLALETTLRNERVNERVSERTAPVTQARIMYIDDDQAVLFMVERLLRRRGFAVDGFQDAERALAALAADPAGFALVVTDYNMPGMSGLDVAVRVRELRPDMPVAIASGFVDESLREKAEGIGVHELLFKETVVERFCEAICELVAR